MFLKDVLDVAVECFIGIEAVNSVGEVVTIFDDRNKCDDEKKLQQIIQEFGDCEVISLHPIEDYLWILIETEYEKID